MNRNLLRVIDLVRYIAMTSANRVILTSYMNIVMPYYSHIYNATAAEMSHEREMNIHGTCDAFCRKLSFSVGEFCLFCSRWLSLADRTA